MPRFIARLPNERNPKSIPTRTAVPRDELHLAAPGHKLPLKSDFAIELARRGLAMDSRPSAGYRQDWGCPNARELGIGRSGLAFGSRPRLSSDPRPWTPTLSHHSRRPTVRP